MPDLVAKNFDTVLFKGRTDHTMFVEVGKVTVYIQREESGLSVRVWENDDRRQSDIPLGETWVSFDEETWPQ